VTVPGSGAERPFDVIVVGAGGSGAPLAARLADDPGCRVLLLEAGPAPDSAAAFPADLLDAGTIRGADPVHPHNWAVPAHLTAGRPYSIARGRILGGSTTVNGGYFIRARRTDFDDWVAAGNPEWSYERSLPFYRSLETDVQYGESGLHGGSGPMPVTRPALERPADGHPVTAAFAAAAAESGFAAETDKNGEQPAGHGPLPMNVRDGLRWNTALAYLLPPGERPNLVVQGDRVVRRVLFDGTRAVGVEREARERSRTAPHDGREGASPAGPRDPAGSPRVELVFAGEVVLAAGSIFSPHLLLVSGVGPRDELERHGVPVVATSPGVGRNLSDHPQVQLRWRPRAHVVRALAETGWAGPAMEWVLNAGADEEVEILPLLKPMGFLLTGSEPEGGSPELAVLVALQRETSRGRLRLVSADPAVPPRLDYHYLSSPKDVAGMRSAVRLAAELLESPAFAAVSAGLSGIDGGTLADDDLIDAWVRANLGTALHLCGSARMGGEGDPGAVVDQFGRVRGVTGLRVADTSILPAAPRRGPAATAVLIGERVAAFIREGR
jgi:choline dehydrogenase-like flavoprotein